MRAVLEQSIRTCLKVVTELVQEPVARDVHLMKGKFFFPLCEVSVTNSVVVNVLTQIFPV